MTRTALTYAKTLDENMTEQAVDIGITTLFLIVGSIILNNLDALTHFDQSSGLKMHSWFKRSLEPSPSGIAKSIQVEHQVVTKDQK
jgi:hypothetical protein